MKNSKEKVTTQLKKQRERVLEKVRRSVHSHVKQDNFILSCHHEWSPCIRYSVRVELKPVYSLGSPGSPKQAWPAVVTHKHSRAWIWGVTAKSISMIHNHPEERMLLGGVWKRERKGGWQWHLGQSPVNNTDIAWQPFPHDAFQKNSRVKNHRDWPLVRSVCAWNFVKLEYFVCSISLQN